MAKVGDVVKWSNRNGGCTCGSGKCIICRLLERHTQYQGTVVKKVGPWLKVWLFDDVDEYQYVASIEHAVTDAPDCDDYDTQVVHESRVTTELS